MFIIKKQKSILSLGKCYNFGKIGRIASEDVILHLINRAGPSMRGALGNSLPSPPLLFPLSLPFPSSSSLLSHPSTLPLLPRPTPPSPLEVGPP